MKISTIMILAAGLGKRMKHYTKKTPKPLIKLGKETLIEKIIKKLEINGFKKIVINIFHFKEKIKKKIKNNYKAKILFSEEDVLLNTGGGIKNAIELLKSKEFFVINSDIVWEDKNSSPFEQLHKFWDSNKMDALLLLYPKGKNKGDYNLNSSKRLISNKNPKYIFTGIQIIKSKVFLEMKKKVFPLSNIYKELLKKERISGIVYKGKWTHIGTLDSLKKQKKMLK
tara:strand:- start:9592 stop:10269 length:678 start_codon:yes stop_codon:yes gene_type:complete